MENIYIIEEGTVTRASELTAEQVRNLTTRELENGWAAVRTTSIEKAQRFAAQYAKTIGNGGRSAIATKHYGIMDMKCRMPDTMTVTAMLAHPTYADAIVHNWNR